MNTAGRRCTAVLFDCDGTLLDTIGDLCAAGNAVCAAHGWPLHDVEEYKIMVGNGQRTLVERFMPPELAGDPAAVEEAYRAFCDHYALHKEDTTSPYPGIAEAVRALSDAGLSLGVLTNKNQQEADELVTRHFGGLFEAVQGRVDGVPAKPDPTMAHALMARLDADPRTTVLVGDTKVDIETGVNAGIATCGVLWGFRSRAELERSGASFLAPTPAELVQLLSG